VPHPLARRIAEALAAHGRPTRVLLLGIGNGRNLPVLLAAGARIDALEEDPERLRAAAARFAAEPRLRLVRGRYEEAIPLGGGFDAALSTHALLHGTPEAVARAVAAVRNRLAPGAPFFATLGSTADPRYGAGERVAPGTFAAVAGPERGVPHAFFDENSARALFAGFDLRALERTDAHESAGRWAHSEAEAASIIHWFVSAYRYRSDGAQ